MKEQWKDIDGYTGLYKVSNLGSIKRIRGKIITNHTNKNGYEYVDLYKNSNRKKFLVHRLVLIAFTQLNDKKLFVNHINSTRSDNRLFNLEWVTRSENMLHGYRDGNCTPYWNGKCGKNHHSSKTVYQYTLDNEFIKEHESTRLAQLNTGVHQSNISSCCIGKIKQSGGFIWKYKE